MLKFEKHGVYNIEVSEGQLFVDATGPFNDELVRDYHGALESAIAQLEKGPWGQIVVLHDLSLFTPEAEKSLIDSVQSRKRRGLTVAAVVCDSPYATVESQISRIYEHAGVPHAIHPNIDAAKRWISASMAKSQAS